MSAETFRPPTLAELAMHGGWWCNAHAGWGEPTDDTAGDVWQRCAVCNAVGGLEWRPPFLQPDRNTKEAQQ